MKIEDLCSDKKDAVSKGFGDFVPLNLNNNKNICGQNIRTLSIVNLEDIKFYLKNIDTDF